MVNIWEIEVRTPPERGWRRIEGFTSDQMRVIRQQASLEGFETLRGFHMWMRAQRDAEHLEGWDYYDVIKEFYGE